MGIVAYCPHGHRIKVKSELAGRKGICPQCGTRFRIPERSVPTPPPVAAAPSRPVTAHGGPGERVPTAFGGMPVARIVSLDGDLAASLPRALPLAAPPNRDAVG